MISEDGFSSRNDTYGHGVVNALRSWAFWIRTLDAIVGGIGGCPFAPGATGNVATEAVVAALMDRGGEMAVDIEKLGLARNFMDEFLRAERRTLPDRDSKACAVCEHFAGNWLRGFADVCWP